MIKLPLPVRKQKALGVQQGKHQYDLPLDKSEGNAFIFMLIILMSLLMTMACATYFALSNMGERWSEGLKGKATIEFAALDENNVAISQEVMSENIDKAKDFLEKHPAVASIEVQDEKAVQNMLSQWLGEAQDMSIIPLPALIRVEFRDDVIIHIPDIEAHLKTISPTIKLDQHQTWLSHVLKFTGALQFFASLIIGIISFITLVAIAGAVKTRIAIHHEEVSLLHLIGATDFYITKQFQKHMTKQTMIAAIIGLVTGFVCLFCVGALMDNMQINLLPEFTFSFGHYIVFLLLPTLMAALAFITTRITVLRTLSKMP